MRAERLAIAEGTVEKQVAKAMRALASGYFGDGADEVLGSETRAVSENETGSPNRS